MWEWRHIYIYALHAAVILFVRFSGFLVVTLSAELKINLAYRFFIGHFLRISSVVTCSWRSPSTLWPYIYISGIRRAPHWLQCFLVGETLNQSISKWVLCDSGAVVGLSHIDHVSLSAQKSETQLPLSMSKNKIVPEKIIFNVNKFTQSVSSRWPRYEGALVEEIKSFELLCFCGR